MRGEAIISMWAILEIFLIMAILYIFFDYFHVSLADVFSAYGGYMFTWLSSAVTSLVAWIGSLIEGLVCWLGYLGCEIWRSIFGGAACAACA